MAQTPATASAFAPLPGPYQGQPVALATRHGKERVLRRPFRSGLGVELVLAHGVDTDSLGSFSGERPRPADALTTCRLKAEAGMEACGLPLGLASEGSYGPHPTIALLPLGLEWLTFIDRPRQLVISERMVSPRVCCSERILAAGEDPAPWLARVGFPAQGLIVRPHQPAGAGAAPLPAEAISKGIHSLEDLEQARRRASALAEDGRVLLQTDLRAHHNPTRMAAIRRLAFRLVRRLQTPCPACQAPGWGLVETTAGLPCAWCGEATALVRAEIHGCASCDHRVSLPRPDGLLQADPGHCDYCNP
jgi:hypothetical protein